MTFIMMFKFLSLQRSHYVSTLNTFRVCLKSTDLFILLKKLSPRILQILQVKDKKGSPHPNLQPENKAPK